MDDKPLFDAVRAIKTEGAQTQSGRLTEANVAAIKKAIAAMITASPVTSDDPLTVRVALELISHEAIVQEAYKDSVGVWTWGVGVTNASGHNIDRYKDNPQSIVECLRVYIWLLRTKYIPAVVKTFADVTLTEAQFAAALSFHYNTEAIASASWVRLWKAGKIVEARASIMEWRKPASIIERREKERDLFFDGKWSGDGKAMVWPVSKPSYTPAWSKGRKVDVSADIAAALAA